jgi:hypothetical protein
MIEYPMDRRLVFNATDDLQFFAATFAASNADLKHPSF